MGGKGREKGKERMKEGGRKTETQEKEKKRKQRTLTTLAWT